VADPDVPGRYIWDGREPGSTDESACRDAEAGVLPGRADACSISPPYRDEEEPPVSPEADRQDSVLPADAVVEKATPGWAHRVSMFADAGARKCWVNLVPADAASRALPLAASAGREVSEHRPYRRVKAVSVPIKSAPGGEEAPVARESLNPWELLEPGSPARAWKALRAVLVYVP
jgi:hypothetical protein